MSEAPAVVVLAADSLAALAFEQKVTQEDLEATVEMIAEEASHAPEAIRLSVYLRICRDPRLFELSADDAIELQLTLLVFAAQAQHASLWIAGDAPGSECLIEVGDRPATARARAKADRILRDRSLSREVGMRRGSFHGVPVLLEGRPIAALVLRVGSRTPEETGFVADEAARALAPLLERRRIGDASGETERMVVEAVERQYIRLALDLHDGPLQQVALLAAEVKQLRDQLPVFVEGADLERATGHVQDIEAVIIGLDRELREIVRVQMPDLDDERRFGESLRATADLFAARARVPVEFEVCGDVGETPRSQRIALLRILQEALVNIREHSGATAVRVIVCPRPGGIRLQVVDNGCGFDVANAIERARRAGRFGLTGMSARVLLLGGSLDIDSNPGGPTVITAEIPTEA